MIFLKIKQLKNKNTISLIDAAMTPYSEIDFNYDYLITNPRKFYKIYRLAHFYLVLEIKR